MELKLTFGLKDGKLVEIDEVERGLACSCICPYCKSKLIARKGKKKVNHFAHYKNPECKYGQETALHIAAKDIFLKYKKIKLPAYFKEIPGFGTQKIKDAQEIVFDNAILEEGIGSIIPDIILKIKTHPLLVEIAVTHFIDDEKKKKIKNLNLSTIEINLKDIDKKYFNYDELKKVLIDETERKEWIFYAKENSLINKKKEELIALKEKEDIENEKNGEILRIQNEPRRTPKENKQYNKQKEVLFNNNKKEVIIKDAQKPDKLDIIDNCSKFRKQSRANLKNDCWYCKYFYGFNEKKNILFA